VANASLLDEATAVAEAVLLMRRANKNKTAKDGKTVLDADLLPQTIAIVLGRAEALGFEVEIADLTNGLPDGDINGIVLQQPGVSGRVFDHSGVIAEAKDRGALVTVAADLLALTLITPPGEQGADIAVGSAQRFGVPLFFGGPHAAYMAVREGMERTSPAASWAFPRTTPASPPTAWHSRPASSTSAARRPRPTSAPRRRCWPSSPPSTPSTTAPTG
jgi:glycine dehydrogenase